MARPPPAPTLGLGVPQTGRPQGPEVVPVTGLGPLLGRLPHLDADKTAPGVAPMGTVLRRAGRPVYGPDITVAHPVADIQAGPTSRNLSSKRQLRRWAFFRRMAPVGARRLHQGDEVDRRRRPRQDQKHVGRRPRGHVVGIGLRRLACPSTVARLRPATVTAAGLGENNPQAVSRDTVVGQKVGRVVALDAFTAVLVEDAPIEATVRRRLEVPPLGEDDVGRGVGRVATFVARRENVVAGAVRGRNGALAVDTRLLVGRVREPVPPRLPPVLLEAAVDVTRPLVVGLRTEPPTAPLLVPRRRPPPRLETEKVLAPHRQVAHQVVRGRGRKPAPGRPPCPADTASPPLVGGPA